MKIVKQKIEEPVLIASTKEFMKEISNLNNGPINHKMPINLKIWLQVSQMLS